MTLRFHTCPASHKPSIAPKRHQHSGLFNCPQLLVKRPSLSVPSSPTYLSSRQINGWLDVHNGALAKERKQDMQCWVSHGKLWQRLWGTLSCYLKGQCHEIQWFLARAKKWPLLAQVLRTSDHDSLVSCANSFAGQDESSKCHFLRSCLVAAIIFPHTKWLKKKHRLSWYCRFTLSHI